MSTKRRWRTVSNEEVATIANDLGRRGICYNGCLFEELQRIYGTENVKHVKGYGWYKLA